MLSIVCGAAENQKENRNILIGSTTYSVVAKLSALEREQFFSAVRLYFATACDYIRHKFPLEDVNLKMAEVA